MAAEVAEKFHNMNTAIVICCNKTDECLLPELTKNLNQVYPDAAIWVAPCAKNPPQTTLPLTPSIRWHTDKVSDDILAALYHTGADVAAKIDADTWHLKPYLFDMQGCQAAGIQWGDRPCYFLGLGYALTRSAIIKIMATQACGKCRSIEEDQAISWRVRTAFPNGVWLHSVGTARRIDSYTQEMDASVIHLGVTSDRATVWKDQQQLVNGGNYTPKHKVLISLTTTPRRLEICHLAIASLLNQSIPCHVRLCIPEQMQRTGEKYDKEKIVTLQREFPLLEIVRCNDYGPAAKLIPSLSHSGDECLIIADDDILYPYRFAERLARSLEESTADVVANRINTMHGKRVAQGFSGIAFLARNCKGLVKKCVDLLSVSIDTWEADDIVISHVFQPSAAKYTSHVEPLEMDMGDSLKNARGIEHNQRYKKAIVEIDQTQRQNT